MCPNDYVYYTYRCILVLYILKPAPHQPYKNGFTVKLESQNDHQKKKKTHTCI